ncbi:MAG: hypothetical protein AUK27_04120 [Deltaproteobacteria bacterium CG2_30_66_27]|nr:MAG: hypothetical protein AUK27_04120 [Deltaproteobacteria bacterium CG2_30_66_27]
MAFSQEFQIGSELLHLLLAFLKGGLHRLRLATLGDISDEVVEHLSLLLVFIFLSLGSPRRFGELLRYHLLHSSEHVGEAFRVREPV